MPQERVAEGEGSDKPLSEADLREWLREKSPRSGANKAVEAAHAEFGRRVSDRRVRAMYKELDFPDGQPGRPKNE